MKRTNFKVCCQGFREKIIAVFYQPIFKKGILVRINKEEVAQSFFYWELIIFMEKVILIILCTQFESKYKDVQLIFAAMVLAFFLTIQVYNKPYFTERLNKLHIWSIVLCLSYCICRVIMESIIQINNGGQSNPEKTSNAKESLVNYIATRGFVE